MENATILIVDDEASVRNQLSQLLERNGYSCLQAADADEARVHLRNREIELVLSDIEMPHESGLDLIHHLRIEYPDTAVIMVTAIDDPQEAKIAMEMGVYGYIIKPFDPNQVIISVGNALSHRRLEKKEKAYKQKLEEAVRERTLQLEKTVRDLKKSQADLIHEKGRFQEAGLALEEKNNELLKAYSDLKKTQSRIIQQEKMASIGQLAAGVAHEINNPTCYVSSNLKTLNDYQIALSRLTREFGSLIEKLKAESCTTDLHPAVLEQIERIEILSEEMDMDFIIEDIPKLLQECREGMDRIKKITIDLKDFAHPGRQELSYADINQNLDSTLNIVWNEIKYKAKVFKSYGGLPQIMCYPQQLNQVFMNLLVNAAQAIEREGEIRITTKAEDGNVIIRIGDTGKGISPDDLKRIFDPFFTTKEVGNGTGLGLHVAYNIIKRHKGDIKVESEVGKGTVFSIRIPIDHGQEDSAPSYNRSVYQENQERL